MSYGPLVISINGYHVYPDQIEATILQNEFVGGVILFSSNYQDKEQLMQLTSEIHTLAMDANKDLFIMVDHEGGYVQRLRAGFTAVPAASVLGQIYDINPEVATLYAYQLGETVGRELNQVGVDIVLGPVVDLDLGNAVISGLDRAYHHDPKIVTEIAGSFISGLQDNGVHATLKHFPGHGADIGDSHEIEPVDNRSWEELSTQDLQPFINLIDTQSIGAIMPAHITYPCIDSDNSAGTSQLWLQDILRGEMQFEGVIISDCLSMAGAGNANNFDKILNALEYGDLALLSHQSPQEYLSLLDMLQEQQFEWSAQSESRVQNWLSPEARGIDTTEEALVSNPANMMLQLQPVQDTFNEVPILL